SLITRIHKTSTPSTPGRAAGHLAQTLPVLPRVGCAGAGRDGRIHRGLLADRALVFRSAWRARMQAPGEGSDGAHADDLVHCPYGGHHVLAGYRANVYEVVGQVAAAAVAHVDHVDAGI